MDRAMVLLANKSTAGKATCDGGSSSSVELVGSTAANAQVVGGPFVEGERIEVGSNRKRARDDGEGNLRGSSSRKSDVVVRHGAGKSFVIPSATRESLPPYLQPKRRVLVEVLPGERWTAGANVPLQVFDAFNLPQDHGSCTGRSRKEIADRCLSRIGRAVSDFVHVSNCYLADEERVPASNPDAELAVAREGRNAAEKKVFQLEQEIIKAAEVAEEKKKLEANVKSLENEIKSLKISAEVSKELVELRAREGSLVEEKEKLERNVVKLTADVEQGIEDTANAIGVGYGKCLERVVAAGFDPVGNSFDDYCAGLAEELARSGGIN